MIGVPTLAAGNPQAGGTAAGIGFAIPSNMVQDIAGQIVRKGRVVNSHHAALGVTLADNLARPGAVIAALQTGGPADKAGMAVGDSIESIDSKAVTTADDVATALAALRPGQAVTVVMTQPEIVSGASQLHDAGARTVMISRGPDPAILLENGSPPTLVALATPVFEPLDHRGAGDSMFAATGVGLARGMDARQAVRLGAAAGALNVTRRGLGTGTRQEVEQLAEHVTIEPVDPRSDCELTCRDH